jgi:hypothetical protein
MTYDGNTLLLTSRCSHCYSTCLPAARHRHLHQPSQESTWCARASLPFAEGDFFVFILLIIGLLVYLEALDYAEELFSKIIVLFALLQQAPHLLNNGLATITGHRTTRCSLLLTEPLFAK